LALKAGESEPRLYLVRIPRQAGRDQVARYLLPVHHQAAKAARDVLRVVDAQAVFLPAKVTHSLEFFPLWRNARIETQPS
jgi:hypothetical protein